ncbi:hypothetical protein LAh9_137 [Aeromonas phage LAh_9]|uniref:Uncharacterized protein n=3 Tax=Lahexavirus TaxID=2843411 RepID=A0A514A0S0_9CAUD|nr:hypothetical protein HWC30_gp025 [Aeromonas phage LAh_6]YP_009847422.1 hypothetical protein HWC31_gp084 [Aeromonas phage LAh_8]YP_009847619.1 hypothetical protein HWC32_gp138 [Aeromonas phage LAh_9]QDH46489.1 hypothetical protein LAh6_25 [Aeromonas phage LAh_6]QDH46726.1 hypothetical protein LAh8_83 [Aeromonas phage LAh_8]QDH46870.1 hypothetical protein LAh9_137 [Aeromonas phage LAh_9]
MGYFDDKIQVNKDAGPYPLGMGLSDVAGEMFGRGFAAAHQAVTDTPPTVGIQKEFSSTSFPTPDKVQAPESGVLSPQQAVKANPTMPTQNLPPTSNVSQATKPPKQMESGLQEDPQITYLKEKTSNKMSGTGDRVTGLEEAPPELPPAQQFAQQLDDWGTQVSFDQTKVPTWHDSDAFSYSLINFGLNLLSGNDLATSFNLAGRTFTDMYGKEKREAWAEDLRKQGYSDAEIQQWIQTGNAKDLTDPMEKKMKLQQFNLAQAQLDQALYESSPEMREYARKRQAYDDKIASDDRRFERDYKMEQLGLDKARLGISQQELELRKGELASKRAVAGQKYTEGLEKARNHYLRAQQGLQNYETVMQDMPQNLYAPKGVSTWVPGGETAARFENAAVTKLAASGDPMQIEMARTMDPDLTTAVVYEKEWLAPVMRKDSGAAVSHSEWLNMGNIYFPRPTDTPQQQDMKRQAREVVTISMNPDSSDQIRQAVQMYSSGALKGLRMVKGQAYANDGTGWFPVPMFKE